MRSSTAALSALIAVATLGLSACKEKEKPASSSQPAAEETAAEPAPARVKREKQPMFRGRGDAVRSRYGLLDITYAEIQGIIPTLAGAVQVSRPSIQTGGRQVNISHCVTGDDIGKIEAELREKLAALGFDSIEKRDRKPVGRIPKDPLVLIAQKPPYRVTIAARRAPFYDCRADQKKTKIVMSFFKRSDKNSPVDAPDGVTAAGPATTPLQ